MSGLVRQGIYFSGGGGHRVLYASGVRGECVREWFLCGGAAGWGFVICILWHRRAG